MADRKTVTMTQDEFQAALDKVAESAAHKALEGIRIGDQPALVTNGVGDEVKALFSELVLQMTEINQQGQPKTKISPEEARHREAATAKAWQLIEAARQRNERPEYRLVTPVYLNERLVQPYVRDGGRNGKVRNVEIFWTGMPSLAMLPVNDVAKEIYAAFKESIGTSAKLGRIVGPHGGATRVDDRPYVITPGGLSVKGDPESRATATASVHPFADALDIDAPAGGDNNDPNAEFVHVLGTVAKPLRRGENAPRS